MRNKGILSFFVLFTLAVILAMPGQSEAFDQNFVGTYFAGDETGVIGEDPVESSLIVTINKGGNCSVIYSIQGTTLFGDAFPTNRACAGKPDLVSLHAGCLLLTICLLAKHALMEKSLPTP